MGWMEPIMQESILGKVSKDVLMSDEIVGVCLRVVLLVVIVVGVVGC